MVDAPDQDRIAQCCDVPVLASRAENKGSWIRL